MIGGVEHMVSTRVSDIEKKKHQDRKQITYAAASLPCHAMPDSCFPLAVGSRPLISYQNFVKKDGKMRIKMCSVG